MIEKRDIRCNDEMNKMKKSGDNDNMKYKVKFFSSLIAVEVTTIIAFALLGVGSMDRSRSFSEQVNFWSLLAVLLIEFAVMVLTGNIAVQIYEAIIAKRSDKRLSLSSETVQGRVLEKALTKASDKILWQLCSKNKKLVLNRLELLATGLSKTNVEQVVALLMNYTVDEKWPEQVIKQPLFRKILYKNGHLKLYFNEDALDTIW